MSNPVLTRGFTAEDLRPGYAAGTKATKTVGWEASGGGPVVSTGRVMTMGNTVLAIGVCFVLLLGGGVVGWIATESAPAGQAVSIPGWVWVALLVAFALVLVGVFKPRAAPVVAPLYAIAEGIFLGSISKVFENQWDGIVVQAVLATASVFVVVLVLYALRVVKVTNRFVMGVLAATVGILLLYVFAIVLGLFGVELGFLYGGGPMAILISIAAVTIASLNLFIDFAVVERGVKAQAPAYMEWFAALGLMVTVVWLYLEMLRLLGNLRS